LDGLFCFLISKPPEAFPTGVIHVRIEQKKKESGFD
jgi:hypothetical protein